MELRGQAAAACCQQQPIYRSRTTCLVAIEAGPAIEDGVRCFTIGGLGLMIGQVMGEIGADDDERVFAAPNTIQDLRDFLGTRLAHDEGQKGERTQQRLQEWQMHFDGMLECMRLGVYHYVRQC